MAFGICSAISAISAGRLVKCVPQYIIVYTTIVLNLAIVFFLLFWDRVPSYPITFITLACWGLCDGIFNSIPPGKGIDINSLLLLKVAYNDIF